MTTRLFISTGAALGALVIATPSLAQNNGPEMTYEERGYEYAQPAPPQPPRAAPITYTQQPVIQPLPPRTEYAQPVRYAKQPTRYVKSPVRYVKDPAPAHHGADYEVEYEYDDVPTHHSTPAPHYPPAHHAAPIGHHPAPHHPQPTFDRDAWMSECMTRISGGKVRRDGNGKIIGGLVGAAAGGLIGNRVAGRGDRLAGTLIGGGVGALAGLAVGSAVDGKNGRRSDEAYAYCEDWLARYSGGAQYGYQHHGYAYRYARPMMLVPVWVQVPQRAVTKEYVTYEYYEEEVVTYETVPGRRKVIERAPAPKPVKRYVKQPSKPRYTKTK